MMDCLMVGIDAAASHGSGTPRNRNVQYAADAAISLTHSLKPIAGAGRDVAPHAEPRGPAGAGREGI